jgi:peptide/nickel transport system permease protein
MGYYIFKRLITIIPFGLLAILLVFYVFESSWDPNSLSSQSSREFQNVDQKQLQEARCAQRRALHLDWPVFYFSISSQAIPSDINQTCSEFDRRLISLLCYHNGNSEGALNFLASLNKTINTQFDQSLDQIFTLESVDEVPALLAGYPELVKSFSAYENNDQSYKIFIPKLRFHFAENRFHEWVSNLAKFDLGKSSVDNQLISKKINNALSNTLIFTLPAVLIIFTLSILIGLWSAQKKGKGTSLVSNFLYLIDSIPLIWLSIIIILIASYLGLGYSTLDIGTDTVWGKITRYGLPTFTLIIASIPYVSKQIQQSIEETESKPFVRMAIAKGLTKKAIFAQHILPNASLPIVTLFFNYLAYAFGGAFVVEIVFSINGIGKLMADSVLANDLMVIAAIILYLIFIKMLLTLLSDVVNYWLNPSIKF